MNFKLMKEKKMDHEPFQWFLDKYPICLLVVSPKINVEAPIS